MDKHTTTEVVVLVVLVCKDEKTRKLAHDVLDDYNFYDGVLEAVLQTESYLYEHDGLDEDNCKLSF